jgi:tryptophan-rich sensory protein
MKINFKTLFICLLLPFLTGYLGSIVTYPSIPTWYQTLTKPSFSPANWVFGFVWSILYFLMGISLYMVVKNGINTKNKKAVCIFAFQLVLNTLWSVVFFGLHLSLWALLVIGSLWILILANIIAFYRLNKKAAYLLVPYLLWVSFASLLNLFIYLLNR